MQFESKGTSRAGCRKILQVTRIAKGGVAVVLENLVLGLAERGRFEPVVVFDTRQDSEIRQKLLAHQQIAVFEFQQGQNLLAAGQRGQVGGDGIRPSRVERYLGKSGVRAHRFIQSCLRFCRQDLPAMTRYRRLIPAQGIALVHTHSDLLRAKPEILAAYREGIPCVTHRHGFARYTAFEKLFFRYVAKNIYISSEVMRYHVARGEDANKGIVIHNGIDPGRFKQGAKACEDDETGPFGQGRPVVGLIARLDWWKGHEFFIEALGILKDQGIECQGVIVGGLAELHYARSKSYFEGLKDQVRQLGLERNVAFLGHQEDVARWLARFDVVVHASSTPEPFGLTIIEALATSRPVVATAAGGVLDIIEDGVNGLLVPCRNGSAMARAIRYLLAHPVQARMMARQGRARVERFFTSSHQVAKLEGLYQQLLS